jgi:hypothetical protein
MGRVLLAHEVGPHPIPDHDNDLTAGRSISRRGGSRREQHRQQQLNKSVLHGESSGERASLNIAKIGPLAKVF